MKAAKIKKLGVLTVGLGLFMAMLDTTIVTISIPAMMKDFNTSTSNIAWVLDAYLLVLAMLILVMGRLADQYGRRLLYGIGVGIFTVGSLLCAVSWGVGWLVGFRCLFEKLQSKPMMDLGLFKSVTFSSAVLGQCLVAVGMLGAMYLLTLFLQNVLGYSALKAALSVTPIPLTALVLAPGTGKICDKIGGRPVTVLGVIALVVGLYLCSQLGADSGWGDIAWRAVIVGMGFGLSNVGLAAASMGAVKAGKEGVGSGVLNMSRMIGMALGVAVCVALLANYATAPMNEAKTEIATIIMADQQLPAALKGQIAEKLVALGEQNGPQAIPDLEAMAVEMGAPEAVLPHLKELSVQIKTIVRTNMSRAFSDVDEVVAIACSFGLLPALLLGKPKKRAGGETAAHAGIGLSRPN